MYLSLLFPIPLLSMPLTHVSFLVAFYRSVLGVYYGQLAEERVLEQNFAVALFLNKDGEAAQVFRASIRLPADGI